VGIEPYLDEDSIVFAVKVNPAEEQRAQTSSLPVQTATRPQRARRRRRRRNRIKTRGWKVVAKIRNSKGLVANVYEPMVQALEGRQVVRSEQRRVVRQLIVSNGNDPSEESVDYFLDNTLEYLAQKQSGELAAVEN
jgi:hypothetical protein